MSMIFHEDVIFKKNGALFGQELIELVKIKGKIVQMHQTEWGIVDPKMYKPDLVIELEDKIIIFEFQSTIIDASDKRRFRFYTALIDHLKVKSKKFIEVHVLSTIEKEQVKWYNVSAEARFPIYIHSLKNIDGDKVLNKMIFKIKNNKNFTSKELLMVSLFCFMNSDESVEYNILNSANIITDIPNLDEELSQFVKGIILLLCDKFVKDELLNTEITNKVGGNMKVIEDYAQRKVDAAIKNLKYEMDREKLELKEEMDREKLELKEEMDREKRELKEEMEREKLELKKKMRKELEKRDETIIINLDKKGFPINDIMEMVNVNLDFVEKTLSK